MDRLQIALERARVERDTVPPPRATMLAAAAPEDTMAGIRTVAVNPSSMLGTADASASYKMLRTRVLQKMKEHGWNTLAVVSPAANDGKTFTAINLAIAIAGDTQHSTLLVDLDLRRPSIHRRFGFEPEYGVDDCLQGKISLAAAMVAPVGFNKLVLLPAREPQRNSSELLTSEHAVSMVKEIKERYSHRIAIFDLPPVLGADDALAFAPLVDCALVVVGASHTRRDELARCLEVLHNIPIIGTVLNGSRTEHSSGYVY